MLDKRQRLIRRIYDHAYRYGKYKCYLHDLLFETCNETNINHCSIEQLNKLMIKMREIHPPRKPGRKPSQTIKGDKNNG